ncbi:MAG TPA: hypothetical protein DCP06_04615, partial [Lachnospiraceae bacterium]|nr:hypothetical protein [Lachnospiraceae bacterium]
GKALKVVSVVPTEGNEFVINVEGDTATTSDKFTVKFTPAFLATYGSAHAIYTMAGDVVVSTKKADI